jgi:hypothetical protein
MNDNELVCMSRDDAAKFSAGARKIRDGLDDFSGRMAALSAVAGTLSQDCLDLADGAPAAAGGLVQMLGVVATILGSCGQTIGKTANDMRLSADEFSRKVRAIELEIRKGSQA